MPAKKKKSDSQLRLFVIKSSKKMVTKKGMGACFVEEYSLVMNGILNKKPFYFEGTIEDLSFLLNKIFNGQNWHLKIN